MRWYLYEKKITNYAEKSSRLSAIEALSLKPLGVGGGRGGGVTVEVVSTSILCPGGGEIKLVKTLRRQIPLFWLHKTPASQLYKHIRCRHKNIDDLIPRIV